MKQIAFIILILTFSLPVSGLSNNSDALFSEAESRYKNGDYVVSLKQYNEFIKEYPMSRYVPDALFRRAVIEVRTGDLDSAENHFEEIDARYTSEWFTSYLPFWEGIISYRKSDFLSALSLFSRFVKSGETHFRKEGIVYKARSEYELKKISNAVKTLSLLEKEKFGLQDDQAVFSFYLFILEQKGDYSKVLQLFNENNTGDYNTAFSARIKLTVAEAFYKSGKFKQAENYYYAILNASPEISSVGFIRLFTLYKKDVEKQKEILSRAQLVLSEYPRLIQNFYIQIGIESFKQGKLDSAFSYLNRVWLSNKRMEAGSIVPLYLASIYEKKKKPERAEKILVEYIKNSEAKDEKILFTLGDFYMKDMQWEKAGGILSEFLNSFPSSALGDKAAWLYSYSLYKQRKFQSSLAVLNNRMVRLKAGILIDSFIRLKSKIFMSLNRGEDALILLKEYIPLHPSDMGAKIDFMILSFQLHHYRDVSSMYGKIIKDAQHAFRKDNRKALLLGTYINGIVHIGTGEFDEGVKLLKSIDKKYLLENDLESIYPYIAYYLGWAFYSKADYTEAVHWFSLITTGYRKSGLYPRALYLSGWSSYLLKDFSEASNDFALYSKAAEFKDQGTGLFYYGKVMAAKGETEKAELIFQSLYTSRPEDAYADDALYTHAQLLEGMGKDKEAILLYNKLSKIYTRSPLAEEGMYKIGELYYKEKQYDNARQAFYTYRSHYPHGKMTDASLYWGGMSALKMSEKYGALIVWEKLVMDYKKSPFRSEILRKIAKVYSDEGEYKKALKYYSEFVVSFPKDSSVQEVNREIEKLKLLQSGLGDREASLLIVLDNKGISSHAGREAAIELAQLYLYNNDKKWGKAYTLLKEVASQQKKDKDSAARAQYYIGEYFSKKYLWAEAVKAFVRAASMNPADRDLAAISIYHAAENAALAGDTGTVKKMVNLLELNFPSSQWLSEGRKLLEGKK